MRPGDPAGGRSVSLIISRMCSTDAEDMLPTSARERRLAATALVGQLQRPLHRVDHLGAARVADPAGDVVDGQVVLGEEAGDAVGEAALDHGGQLGCQHDAEAVVAQPPAERVAAVGVDRAAGGDDLRSGPRVAALGRPARRGR